MRISSVLVPLDFSIPSRLALDHAVSLARTFRARLTLLNVVETSSALAYAFPAMAVVTEMAQVKQARKLLSTLLAPEDQDDLDLRVLVKTGNAGDTILSCLDEEKADLLVMGTHGRGLLGRTLIGSTTSRMLRRVSVPIVTVRGVAPVVALKRILFATDLSEASTMGFLSTLETARATNATVILFHSVDLPVLMYTGNGMPGIEAREFVETARGRLDELARMAAQQCVNTETVLVEGGAAGLVLKAAEDSYADVIVMSIEKKGFLERAVLGSTAERVIREAHIPVLSIPVHAWKEELWAAEPRATVPEKTPVDSEC